MRERLAAIGREASEALAGAASPGEIEALRVRYLGKKGALTAVLQTLGTLPAQERPVVGQLANEIRADFERRAGARAAALEAALLEASLKAETLDATWPGQAFPLGHTHPMTLVLDEVKDIFTGMGFTVAEGPEVETTWYCFDALNTDVNHPARDRQDTFYVTDDVILRTQTSSVQIRHMLAHKPPIRIISPGRVYRKDEVDATHSPMFHQIEGLVVDKGITMGHLKGTLDTLMKAIYGPETVTRFRPHHFPYTEPSAEVDIRCYMCGGEGCRVCKGEGWIELLGCGMVHPKVLSLCGIDPEVYSGFAFGIGLERITLGRFAIDDMRLLFENDLRFLAQFR
ncbi:MAG: phenylalanine--tRNA ligase subunit alpha [Oscillospiraceae bacterium]|jgi:phenylalanyl-tRNA synthetase alpha chain|nr:phenylalanine--tRNA ligase subunit alpha [Oscillospiraceae bacterium]